MNIYKLSQTINNDYDTFDSCIVIAKNEEEAVKVHPMTEKDRKLKSLYLCLENVVNSYDDRYNKSNGKSDFETNIEMSRELLKEVSDD